MLISQIKSVILPRLSGSDVPRAIKVCWSTQLTVKLLASGRLIVLILYLIYPIKADFGWRNHKDLLFHHWEKCQ